MNRLLPTQEPVNRLVSWFEDGTLAIPEIQREYVWKPEKVRDLAGSIFSEFPCGSLILWEPRRQDILSEAFRNQNPSCVNRKRRRRRPIRPTSCEQL